jgi:alpha-tubulin suppressor-like RCC1 family protein
VGGNVTCGITAANAVWCWGADDFGQLGDGGTNTDRSTPVQVATGGTDWVQVSAGQAHTCARRRSGILLCWGSDGQGSVGDGTPGADQGVPVEVFGGATDWARVSAGNSVTCATRTTGRLYCWGYDEYGAVGDNQARVNQYRPRQVAGGATNWRSVSADVFHTCAVRTIGRAWCWGRDPLGELGDGPGDSSSGVPRQVAGGRTDWASISVGTAFTCARRTTGRLFCWGRDEEGTFGDGPADNSSPVPVPAAGGTAGWSTVSSGGQHVCARRTTGRLFCWGYNASGALGNGGGTPAVEPRPVQVAGGATDWTSVDSSEDYHTCARITTGRIFCWGLDDRGQLGNGTAGGGTEANRPQPVWA